MLALVKFYMAESVEKNYGLLEFWQSLNKLKAQAQQAQDQQAQAKQASLGKTSQGTARHAVISGTASQGL